MSTTYSGDPANVSNSLTRTISGAANNGSGFVRITTSVPHLFSNHDIVIITGVTGTTEANGTWNITVIDSTHFDITAVFTHAYVSGGSVTDHSLTPAATLPSDGEQVTASSIISAIQVCLDRTQFLATEDIADASIVLVPPFPANISYGSDWSIGDDGTGTATGSRLVKLVANDSGLLFELTPFLQKWDGRKLAQVTAFFAVGTSHSGIPANLPDMRIYRTQSLTSLGVAPASDQSLIAATDAFFPTPVSGTAYYNSGHLQSWNAVTDQNNVIDVTRRYYLVLIDESGANALSLNQYFGFQLFVN